MSPGYLIVVSEEDPVAPRVAAHWGTPESTGDHVDRAAVRRLRPGVEVVRRPGFHVHDERLDGRLPARFQEGRSTLVFPSVHRSEQGVECLTVHPLGNPGPTADVGGRPGVVNPTDPGRMTAALRLLAEGGAAFGAAATFEATHHGPELALPSFYVEIGYGERPAPSAESVALLARTIPELTVPPDDHIAFGVGGGHYAPHFTDLALRRRWSFGHLLSRHALETTSRETVRSMWASTPNAEGLLFARARDAELPVISGLAPRLRDGAAPPRG